MNPKAPHAAAKLPLHLVPASAVALASLGMLDGALRYGRGNWRDPAHSILASDYAAAAGRHLASWWEGDDQDARSGLPPLAHALASLMIVVDAEAHGTLVDDRALAAAGQHAAWMDELSRHVSRLRLNHAGHPEPVHFDRRMLLPVSL